MCEEYTQPEDETVELLVWEEWVAWAERELSCPKD